MYSPVVLTLIPYLRPLFLRNCYSPLREAVRRGHTESVRLLLDAGAKVKFFMHCQWTCYFQSSHLIFFWCLIIYEELNMKDKFLLWLLFESKGNKKNDEEAENFTSAERPELIICNL